MIDVHCHLLPGVDDGPATMEDAIRLARAQVAAGVDEAVATPHVTGGLRNDAASVAAGVAALRAALADAGVPLRVWAGAEIELRHGLELDDGELRRLALGDGPWLLLEAPLQEHPTVELAVEELMVRGHGVLLAHPERCPSFQRDPDALRRLVHRGALTQVTAGAFLGRFGRTAQRFAARLADDALVHTIASDAHDLDRRSPGMREGLAAAGLGRLSGWLTEDVPAALLAGDGVPSPPAHGPLRRRRRWWPALQRA